MDFGISESKVRWKQILVRMPPKLLKRFSELAEDLNVPTCDLITFTLCFGQLKDGHLSNELKRAFSRYRATRQFRNCHQRGAGVKKRMRNRDILNPKGNHETEEIQPGGDLRGT